MSDAVPVGGQPLPPGPGGAGVANLLRTSANFTRFREALRSKYGEIVYYRTPTALDICVVHDPALVDEVFTAKIPDPGNPGGPPVQAFTKWQVTEKCPYIEYPQAGLNATDDAEHDRAVKLTLEAFTGPRFLEAHSARIIENVRALHEKWRPGRKVRLMRDLHEFMALSVAQAVLGPDLGALRPRAVLDAMTLFKWDSMMQKMPGSAPLRKLALLWFKRSLKEFDAAIFRAMHAARRSAHDPHCVASYMVAANQQEVDEEGADRLCTDGELHSSFYQEMASAIDPPTYGIVQAVGEVAWRRDVRERLEQEVDEVLGGREMTPADYDRLPYARAILHECLRMQTPAPTPPRVARADYVLGGYRIPRGTTVLPVLDVGHRDPQYWDDAEAFRPERWLEDPQPERPQHAYMPFGYTQERLCSGKEFFLRAGVFLLAGTAQHLRLELAQAGPLQRTTSIYMLVIPKGSATVTVTKRPAPGSGVSEGGSGGTA